MGSRPTIEDVARVAGVSRQTVSRALNDKGEIGADTKQRVIAAAAELSYRPNRFARGLVGSPGRTVGVVLPDIMNPFFPEVLAGITEATRVLGWSVLLEVSGGTVEGEARALQRLTEEADAIVGYLLAPDSAAYRVTDSLPCLHLDGARGPKWWASVHIDMAPALDALASRLESTGHSKVGMIDSQGLGTSTRRMQFDVALRRHGIPGITATTHASESDAAGGRTAMSLLLDTAPDLTAVLAFNDLIAIGAMSYARSRGLDVPSDCAVIGVDGLALGELVTPTLSTLSIDKRQLGVLAVRYINETFSGPPPTDLLVTAQLLLRESI